MSIVTWPDVRPFMPQAMSFGASTPKSAFKAFFTGTSQKIGHLSDRLRCRLSLPPCNADGGQLREALLLGLASTGDLVRMRHLHRLAPLGSMRGTPTVAAAALAGARTLRVQTTAYATLSGGDMLATGNQLLMVAYQGAAADAGGLMDMPLVLPLLAPVSSGAAVVWDGPTGVFELITDGQMVDYQARRLQSGLDLDFIQS